MKPVQIDPSDPVFSREVRNRWDWYRVVARERLHDPVFGRLSAEALGVLEKLCWLAWEQGVLPEALSDLAFLTRLREDELSRALPTLIEFGLVQHYNHGSRSGLWIPHAESHMRQLIKEAEERSERARKAAQNKHKSGGKPNTDNEEF